MSEAMQEQPRSVEILLELTVRLEEVLRAEATSGPDDKKASAPSCGLEAKLSNIDEKLALVIQRIEQTIERLQL